MHIEVYIHLKGSENKWDDYNFKLRSKTVQINLIGKLIIVIDNCIVSARLVRCE